MSILAECPICRQKQSTKNRICRCGEDLVKAKRSKKVKYWISYRLPGGKQRREVVAGEGLDIYSIESAREMHAKRVVQKKENRIFDIKPDSKMTFTQLTKWYLDLEKVKVLVSFKTIKIYLNKFNREFGRKIVGNIKLMDLENLQIKRTKQGLRPKTVDDEINYVKTMVIKAFNNDLVGGDVLKAFQRVNPTLKKNSNARDRVLTKEEYELLLEHAPSHLRNILIIGYWTGMRKGEILSLVWDKVHMKERLIRLEPEDTKEGKSKTIPLSETVFRMLTQIPRPIHIDHVFLYNGKPIGRNFSTALKTACKDADILWGRDIKDGFIFHDIRHTFVTNMRRAGVSKSVRMSITGHAPKDMDDRYNKVDVDDQQKGIKKLELFLQFVDQTVDQKDISKLK
jgi:integrase